MGMNDKQVAFISVLHGAAQGAFLRSAQGTCQESIRMHAKELLTESSRSGLPADSQGTW
jgi:hypothetical protein